MNFQKLTLKFYVACFVGFSVPAFFLPSWFAEVLGYELSRDGALMEFIGAYGGLILGVGLYLIYCLQRDVKAGLICVLAVIASLFVGRILGYFVEGEMNAVQAIFLSIESITICLIAGLLYSDKSRSLAG